MISDNEMGVLKIINDAFKRIDILETALELSITAHTSDKKEVEKLKASYIEGAWHIYLDEAYKNIL